MPRQRGNPRGERDVIQARQASAARTPGGCLNTKAMAQLTPAKKTVSGVLYSAPTDQSVTVKPGQVVEITHVDEYFIASWDETPTTTNMDMGGVSGVTRHYVAKDAAQSLHITCAGDVFVLVY